MSRKALPKVLVLSHEDASRTEQLPYMAARCAPVQVVEFFGRAAKRSPPCRPHECVFNWWKAQCSSSLQTSRPRGNHFPKTSSHNFVTRILQAIAEPVARGRRLGMQVHFEAWPRPQQEIFLITLYP